MKPKNILIAFGVCLILLFSIIYVSAFPYEIRVDSPPSAVVGENFNVSILISGENLSGIEFTLLFNKSILEVVKVEEGSFFRNVGSTLTMPVNISNAANNSLGRAKVGIALIGNKSASGNGTLFRITFKGISLGESYLKFANVTFVNAKVKVVSGVFASEENLSVECLTGGFSSDVGTFCCGVSDNVCPEWFDNVACGVKDPDCCEYGGFSTGGGTFCCGVNDSICPENFEGVKCSLADPNC